MRKKTNKLMITAAILIFFAAGCFSKNSDSAGQKNPVKKVQISADTDIRYQYVRGFGGMSNAWASPVINEDDITAMFGENGLGYNIFRIMIYPDPEQWKNILPAAKKAMEYGAIIMASPWTPPPEIKTNKSNIGGKVPKDNYAAYAAHLRSFVDFMAENGVKIYAVSFQNEPDIKVNYDSCDWSPEEMLEFVIGYGREIGDVLIIPGEPFQFSRGYYSVLLSDPEAAEKFDIIGGHIYGGGLFPFPEAAEKGKEVWMTEHLLNSDGKGSFYDDITWPAAMLAAIEIHNCMNAGFNAYIWWYLKRFYSMIGDGEYDTEEGKVLHRGYVMSHYAKYAAGKQRIGVKNNAGFGINATAYEGEDGISFVIICTDDNIYEMTINLPVLDGNMSAVKSDKDGAMRPVPIRKSGKNAAVLRLSPRSITSVSFTR